MFIYDNIYDDGEFLKTHIGKKSELFCSFKVWGAKRTCVDGNKYGYLSRNGEVLIKCEYDYLSQIKDGIARGYKDGELHIINIKLNKISYYALDNWLTDIGLIAEQYLMPMDNHKDEFSFLSQQYKCKIIEGIKSCKWRDYFITLSEVVGDYVEHLNPRIVLERFVSQSPKELLIAPDWGLKNHEFTDKVRQRMRERDSWQGKLYLK